mmetsp:Transcript_12864/g.25740  ORF Transcript_12864/g.25740 Transcript_12864/m.25740 type:complete len:223 (+) Transcript_12864:818-1486(+)
MSSASSSTNTLIVRGSIVRRFRKSQIFPGVPTTMCALIPAPRSTRSPASASRTRRPAMFRAMGVTQFWTIWTASSRVGVTHRACVVAGTSTTIRVSIPMTNAAVFPEPDWACPMRFRGGLARTRGRASSWMAEGLSKPIVKTASRRWAGRFSSWNVFAEVRWEPSWAWMTFSRSFFVCLERSICSFWSLFTRSVLFLSSSPLPVSPAFFCGAPDGSTTAPSS